MAATHDVEIKNFIYSPETVTIAVGDSVRWINRDAAPHTATRNDAPAFNTGLLGQNQSRTVRFDQVSGSDGFEYFCIPHPSMKGKVKVTAAMEPPIENEPRTIRT